MALSGFFSRLKEGLSRSTQKLSTSITAVFTKRKLDDAALDELEELLIAADLGPGAAGRVIDAFRRTRFGTDVTDEEIKTALAEEITAILEPVAQPLEIDASHAPHVVLVVGVNGTGKTTTIGKYAQFYRDQGLRPMLVAGDTFRAAAVEQLQIWGERTGAPVVSGKPETDAAGLAFTALERARREGIDVLLIDTAGRLHNKTALMDELAKIIRVMRKLDPDGAAFHRAGARRDDGPECHQPGRGLPGSGEHRWADRDEAGRLGAWRHRRGAGGGVRPPRSCRGRRRKGRGPASLCGRRVRPRPGRRQCLRTHPNRT